MNCPYNEELVCVPKCGSNETRTNGRCVSSKPVTARSSSKSKSTRYSSNSSSRSQSTRYSPNPSSKSLSKPVTSSQSSSKSQSAILTRYSTQLGTAQSSSQSSSNKLAKLVALLPPSRFKSRSAQPVSEDSTTNTSFITRFVNGLKSPVKAVRLSATNSKQKPNINSQTSAEFLSAKSNFSNTNAKSPRLRPRPPSTLPPKQRRPRRVIDSAAAPFHLASW